MVTIPTWGSLPRSLVGSLVCCYLEDSPAPRLVGHRGFLFHRMISRQALHRGEIDSPGAKVIGLPVLLALQEDPMCTWPREWWMWVAAGWGCCRLRMLLFDAASCFLRRTRLVAWLATMINEYASLLCNHYYYYYHYYYVAWLSWLETLVYFEPCGVPNLGLSKFTKLN